MIPGIEFSCRSFMLTSAVFEAIVKPSSQALSMYRLTYDMCMHVGLYDPCPGGSEFAGDVFASLGMPSCSACVMNDTRRLHPKPSIIPSFCLRGTALCQTHMSVRTPRKKPIMNPNTKSPLVPCLAKCAWSSQGGIWASSKSLCRAPCELRASSSGSSTTSLASVIEQW
eukprot:CAMPEP_0197514744 /NCGR_PEP_ID=MMETSP1318-20131121/91_1 /TAXON_ID=552666 /ORGANISM="Partenskyella glossopodia, Strain RCC365" /LENGTH=168 /DNA_ID=CAMNT_0043062927 /DNA_START=389 /DNA_END=892 /DNA_ORIENTATION=-